MDNSVRHRPGERLEDVWAQTVARHATRVAIDGPAGRLTYAELDARAEALSARLQREHGLRRGDRVGLLCPTPLQTLTSMLAVLKLGGAYVPLDPAFPPERIEFIAQDAGLAAILTDQGVECRALNKPGDEGLAYVIYTSGTTGRPKGVAVSHASICNFVRVAAESYGVRAEDRMYHGLTFAFDFAVEEVWPAWLAGATLVPRPDCRPLLGDELHAFLTRERVTALCCVPTLLATVEEELPDLRFLLVSGEACPEDLVARWHRPGRRFLNVYGPTEATVSCTWTVLDPTRPVTIGVPLPSYAVTVLHPERQEVVEPGQEGEIAVAGIGLAEGYLGQPDRTARAFVADFLGLPHNPSGRLYRTGDLGRITPDGEIEHLGRIDTQVKIRGYRIEPEEVAAVLRELPEVRQAVVAERRGELAAYVVLRAGEALDRRRTAALLERRLPRYMVPAHVMDLAELPLLPSGKVDRGRLPEPSGPRTLQTGDVVPPADTTEATLARTLAEVLEVEEVSVESHFLEELGASSLVLARWSARLRREPELPPVSIRDIYLQPTVRELAAALAELEPVAATAEPELPAPRGTPRPLVCGALQLLSFVTYAALASLAFDALSGWVLAAPGAVGLYLRALACGAGTLLAAGVVPVGAKWLLVGRFTPQRIRVWSLAYVRFWVVKTLVVFNPLARLLVGTPLYNLYLRALGARVGPGALILTNHVPLASDLLDVGAGAVIRREALLNGYRAVAGVIEIGSVRVGAGGFVGEGSVLDINTEVGAGAQLGHGSCLYPGAAVPGGERWHGTPAEPAPAEWDYQPLPNKTPSRRRRLGYGALRLLGVLLVVGPLESLAAASLLTHPAILRDVSPALPLAVAAGLVLGGVAVALLVALTLPRLLSGFLEPGRLYPLYGRHHLVLRAVTRLSNIPALTTLFGDSWAIVGYLRALGYRLGRVEQTGSNFGTEVKHDVPGLCHVGSGTMVSDGLSLLNAEFSAGCFRVLPAEVGQRNYLGNALAWPARARVGDNCLLATKAMVPIGGPVRHDVGLLGSPCFEIPRRSDADPALLALAREPERTPRLRAKARHNLATMTLHLLVEIAFVYAMCLIANAPLGGGGWRHLLGTVGSLLLDTLLVPLALFVGVEWSVLGFRRMQPRTCSILQREFWRHERFWKVPAQAYMRLFDGTPFKGTIWRLVGVRVGRGLFDDGCAMVERSLVELGDGVTLNMGANLQPHTLEDGIFKSGRIRLGDGCTVGPASLVNYDVEMEAGSALEADSFLMKGSRPAAGTRWRGNPAREVGTRPHTSKGN